jgi:hypothetical protein
LIAPGGHLIERAPIEIAAITMTTRRQRQLTPSLDFMLTEHVAFVLIYRGGRHPGLVRLRRIRPQQPEDKQSPRPKGPAAVRRPSLIA